MVNLKKPCFFLKKHGCFFSRSEAKLIPNRGRIRISSPQSRGTNSADQNLGSVKIHSVTLTSMLVFVCIFSWLEFFQDIQKIAISRSKFILLGFSFEGKNPKKSSISRFSIIFFVFRSKNKQTALGWSLTCERFSSSLSPSQVQEMLYRRV